MNRKILVVFVALMAVAVLATPMALALSWEPKNNEKFQTFETAFVPNIANIIAGVANPEFIPSEDNPNKIIYSWVEEPMITYTIMVGGNTYSLGVDFEYTGFAVLTQIGAPFTPSPLIPGLLVGDKQNNFRVDYMYDFGPDDGNPETIDGTIQMLAITAKDGLMHIRSVRATGDLQNVQIQATSQGSYEHIGIVLGWPE